MQSWDKQSKNQSRNFARRGQGAPDRTSSADSQRWANDGGGSQSNYDSPSYGNSYGRRTDNDEFSSYDREGRYDRSERSQYAGSQAQYDRQNTSGWGEDSSPNDESDYRSNYQGFSERSQGNDDQRDSGSRRYSNGNQTGYRRGGNDYLSERDNHTYGQRDQNSPRQDFGSASSRYSQSEYGRGSSMDNSSVRDNDMTRGSRRDAGYNTTRTPETGFSSSGSSRSWDADTERGPYNYGSSRKDWGYTKGQNYEFSNQFGQHSGKGPKGFKRSDERIKEDISEILTHHPEIDASDIEIEVKDGDVTLSGVVPQRAMKHLTEDIVERCMGVHDIQNQLRVKRDDESAYGSSTNQKAGTGTPSSTSSSGKKSSSSSTPGNH